MPERVSLAVIGSGSRGSNYARLAVEDGRAEVVAVAEPDDHRRRTLAEEHGIPPSHCFTDWRELAEADCLADAAIIATQDTMHFEPAMAMIRQGYHILLEKPMATSESECIAIVDEASAAGVVLAVCHVLRYTPYTATLRRTIDSGLIGEIVSVEHLEPVGWWHQAHSFVRGNWNRTDQSTFMLLAKSVHDIDWMTHIVGLSPRKVSSFGSLYHFRADQRPAGAADRCLDCAIEPDCPYSARRIYLSCLGDPDSERWPLSVITDDLSPEGVLTALRDGPYGRCVYDCDNDVVDHQVVNIEYDRGVTASFTMTAFTPHTFRRTRIFGTHGCLEGDGSRLKCLDFRTGDEHTIEVPRVGGASAASGHGGGDAGLIHAFVSALHAGTHEGYLADPREALASHQLTWAAERARLTSSVVDVAIS